MSSRYEDFSQKLKDLEYEILREPFPYFQETEKESATLKQQVGWLKMTNKAKHAEADTARADATAARADATAARADAAYKSPRLSHSHTESTDVDDA